MIQEAQPGKDWEIMPSNLEQPFSNLPLQVRETQSRKSRVWWRWVETCQREAAAVIRRSKCSDLMDYPVMLLNPEQELDIVNTRQSLRTKSSPVFHIQTCRSQSLLNHYPHQQQSQRWAAVSLPDSFASRLLGAIALCSSLQRTQTPALKPSSPSQTCFVYRKMLENPAHANWPKYGTPWNLHMHMCIIRMKHQSFITQRQEQLTA